MNNGIVYAVGAALLFGASTPFAKLLIGSMSPLMLAGLLYAGSGFGLLFCLGINKITPIRRRQDEAAITKQDIPWLAGAVISGGIIAPVLLMSGLNYTMPSSASLLLNLEGVFTALLAWVVFKENFDRRIFTGMVLIIIAGVILTLREVKEVSFPLGSLLVALACLFWGIDNNLTRKVSAVNPVQIACIKGLVAGSVNILLAIVAGFALPGFTLAMKAMLLGFFSYGISLVLFVLALRELGAARTGAYFSLAPFAGTAISLLVLHEVPDTLFLLAAVFMLYGIWLHLTENHEHEHTHEAICHEHKHIHDEHHQHTHDFEWDGDEPHTHPHKHDKITHSHAHYPDIHHRHKHTT